MDSRFDLHLLGTSLVTHLHNTTNTGSILNTLDSEFIASELLSKSLEERRSGSSADVAHLSGSAGKDDSYVLAVAVETILSGTTEATAAATGRSKEAAEGRGG
jgi:hypothetical protein